MAQSCINLCLCDRRDIITFGLCLNVRLAERVVQVAPDIWRRKLYVIDNRKLIVTTRILTLSTNHRADINAISLR
jgi:hypothetical protein